MADINRVTLKGRIGTDPDFKSFGDDQMVCNFKMATTRRVKNKTTEQWEDAKGEPSWHTIEAWGWHAKTIQENFCQKGDPILIEGAIKYGSYDKDGTTIYTTKIRASDVVVIKTTPKTAPKTTPAPKKAPVPTQDSFDDDIPF